MAAVNDAMTQTDGAATNDADETETVLLPVSSVNTMIRACIEAGGSVARREAQTLARTVRGRHSDELVSIDVDTARWGLILTPLTDETRQVKKVFRSALGRVDGTGVSNKHKNGSRSLHEPCESLTVYGQFRTADYRHLSRE